MPASPTRAARFCGPLVAAFATLLAATTLTTSSAHAEEVFTSQAAAANATDSTWIPAPPNPAALCMVDTGNDPNPDTTNVIARLAVDDGDGSDFDPSKHGTLMSMIASAPYNGFGMVGAAPSIKIVSVRATRTNGAFTFADILNGIDTCRVWRDTYNIKVISLSFGARNTGPLDDTASEAMSDAVDSARDAGIDVVAAAGNHEGSADWPAAYGPVLAVGASDVSGQRCGFAASGAEVDIFAAGCPQDVALADGRPGWASGSSEAAAFAAAALAEMRSLRPELTVGEAERTLLLESADESVGKALDVSGAFREAGLEKQLADGHSKIPGFRAQEPVAPDAPVPAKESMLAEHSIPPGDLVPAAVASMDPAQLRGGPSSLKTEVGAPGMSVATVSRALPRPRVHLSRLRRGLLTIRLANKPRGAQAQIVLYVQRRSKQLPIPLRSLHIMGDRLRTRVVGKLAQATITYRDPRQVRGTSAPLTLHPKA